MTALRLSVIWLTCLSLLHSTHGYRGGAPDEVCQTMTPSHNAAPQQTPPTYKVTTSKLAIAPGEQVEITVAGSGNIKGFFIRARQNGNLLDVGDFQSNSIGQIRCNGKGITHTSNAPKDSVKVMWTAPANIASGSLQFVATVVQEKTLFWTMISSADITVGAQTPPLTGMTTMSLPGGMMSTKGTVSTLSTVRPSGAPAPKNAGSSQVGSVMALFGLFMCLIFA